MKRTTKKRRPTAQQVGKARLGVPIDEFRNRSPGVKLSPHQRLTLLDGLETLFEGAYTHLPLKRARYGFDPVQRVRILRMQAASLSAEDFDAEVDDIFNRLRDFHTVYWRPGYEGKVAALPCMVELYFEKGQPRYMVSKVGEWVRKADFVPGVEVDTWNGVPIDRAVQRYADQESGGRPDSMRTAAVQSLTNRALSNYSLPDENSVTIGFRKVNAQGKPVGKQLSVTLEWSVIDVRFVEAFQEGKKKKARAGEVRALAINPSAAAIKKASLLLYASDALRGESKAFRKDAASATVGAKIRGFHTSLPDFLTAATLRGSRRDQEFGYLRLWEFLVPNVREYLEELRSLLALMPPQGLILDVRGNPGGIIVAAEMALQFFTPRTIEPTRFALLATDLNLKLCAKDRGSSAEKRNDIWPWLTSLTDAVRNGELYSAPLPITIPSKCNIAGQVYGGPVILVADTNTYSSGDLFSAGFVDNGIGHMVCVGESTGAGGASIWSYGEMQQFGGRRLRSVLPALPAGGTIQFSLMRATRIGPQLGALIEDVGVSVRPKDRYRMSRDDLLCGNRDLLAYCIGRLERQPYTVMECHSGKSRGTIEVTTKGLDQLDVMLDHHRLESVRIKDGASHTIIRRADTKRVEVCGLKHGRLKQRRIIDETTVLDA